MTNHPTSVPKPTPLISKPAWYAAYTQSRAEKKAAHALEKQGIEHYLPLYITIRQWSDRKKKVEEPLIRSYIFVRITEHEYLPVLQTPGIVKIVTFSGKPVPVPDWQILNLKILLGAEVPVTAETREFEPGEEVQIKAGNLSGLRGTVLQQKGQHKLVIRIDALNYNLTVDIDSGFLETVNSENRKTG